MYQTRNARSVLNSITDDSNQFQIHISYVKAHFLLCLMFRNNYFWCFLSSKHAHQSSGCSVSYNASQIYINSIGSTSVVIYTKFYQYMYTNHSSQGNVRKSVTNNEILRNVTVFKTFFGNTLIIQLVHL